MIRELVFTVAAAATLSAQQTEVAGGYHLVHPSGVTATTSSTEKTGKVATKKAAKKMKHSVKRVANGK